MARILLGVSAGIAACKAVDLASKMTQRGDEVQTILTPHALKFATALSFKTVTGRPVFTDTFEEAPDCRPEHISLAEWPDLIFVAPATADLIGRVAAGLGDNLLTLTLLATARPVLLAPAMNDRMWANPTVQRNVAWLREAGYAIVEPAAGRLACGSTGTGRLPETPELLKAVDSALRDGTR